MNGQNHSKQMKKVLKWTFTVICLLSSFCLLLQYIYMGLFAPSNSLNTHYSSMQQSVLVVDKMLHSLAKTKYSRPNQINAANKSMSIPGAKMLSIEEMAEVTEAFRNIRQPCGGNEGRNKSLLVLLYSTAADVENRFVIRRTFGSLLKQNAQTAIYFVLAKESDLFLQTQIKYESLFFNDIIQFNFKENYYNLTLKTIASLRWTAMHCGQVKFVLKLDNDCYVRPNVLLSQLRNLTGDKLYGRMHKNFKVTRIKQSKWYLDPAVYPSDKFPNFLSSTYMVPGLLTCQLYMAVVSAPQNVSIPALPFEDVYVGVLAKKANISLVDFAAIRELKLATVNDTTLAKYTNDSIFWGQFSSKNIERLWKVFGDF